MRTLRDSRYLVSPPPRESDEDTDEVDDDEDEAPRRPRRNSAFKRAVSKIVASRRNGDEDAAAPARRPQMSTGLTMSFAAKIQVMEEEPKRPLKRKVSSTNDATVTPLKKKSSSTSTRTILTRRSSTARKRHIEEDDDDDDDDYDNVSANAKRHSQQDFRIQEAGSCFEEVPGSPPGHHAYGRVDNTKAGGVDRKPIFT